MRVDNCIFCKIANGELHSEMVYEDCDFKVILDLRPASRGHGLIITKEHYKDVCDLNQTVGAKVLHLAANIGEAMKATLGCAGFNLIQNNGEAAGQTVHHFHMHVIPRYENGPTIAGWTPNEISKEELSATAELMRRAL